MRNVFGLIIFFYLLAILQTSLLANLRIFKIAPNFILVTVLLLNFFESAKDKNGIIAAAAGGFFWDIFSNAPFGFHIFTLVLISLFMKIILRKYLAIPEYHLFRKE